MLQEIKAVQTKLGLVADGDPREKTWKAVHRAICGDTPPPAPGVRRICLDPGHGLGNRNPGVYDPGCVNGALEEATLVLQWAHCLAVKLAARGFEVFWTRVTSADECPVGTRASRAKAEGCTDFISLHVNDADDHSANGVETLYGDDELAARVQSALVAGLALRDRGIKRRDDLAVLKFDGPAVMVEVGFIHHAADVARFTDAAVISDTCARIAAAV